MAVPKVFLRSPYNYDREAVSDETGLACLDESKAIQSQRDEADINTIVKRFGLTGQLPTNLRAPTSGDFLDAPDDYRGALEAVRRADEAFMKMPAAIRARFDNDPALFVDFCSDPNNGPELVKMGLAVERKEPVESSASSEAPVTGAGSP